jgi:hypothetical protein
VASEARQAQQVTEKKQDRYMYSKEKEKTLKEGKSSKGEVRSNGKGNPQLGCAPKGAKSHRSPQATPASRTLPSCGREAHKVV